jgi:glycine hydroxymethyltransferase
MDLIIKNDKMRSESLNMVVSENALSPQVKKALSLQHSRYHASFYGGSRIFQQIYDETQNLAKKIFHCQSAIISPLSGNLSVVAVILALTELKDKIAILPLSPAGGYPIKIEFFNRIRVDIPFNIPAYNIDLDKTLEILKKERPSLVFLGSSMFPFPHPVKSISEEVHSYGGTIAYDGSHVLGLIAGGQFQDPLNEGADLLLGSTHKSFPGPQGGVILSNGFSEEKMEEVIGTDPLKGIVLVDNIHNSRIAALGVAFEEFEEFGKDYTCQVIKNSQVLAQTLDSHNIPLHGKSNGFTESHQVLMQIDDFNKGAELRDFLFNYKIVTDAALRFGTAELTHLGFREKEMQKIGSIIAQLIHHFTNIQQLSSEELNEIYEEIQMLIKLKKFNSQCRQYSRWVYNRGLKKV